MMLRGGSLSTCGLTKAKNAIGKFAFWFFVLALVGLYAAVGIRSAAVERQKAAIGTMLSWLFVAWAWWLDSQREPQHR
jgi:hypothetical protein